MKKNADTNERTLKFQRFPAVRKECMHYVREPRSHMILTCGISCTPCKLAFKQEIAVYIAQNEAVVLVLVVELFKRGKFFWDTRFVHKYRPISVISIFLCFLSEFDPIVTVSC